MEVKLNAPPYFQLQHEFVPLKNLNNKLNYFLILYFLYNFD